MHNGHRAKIMGLPSDRSKVLRPRIAIGSPVSHDRIATAINLMNSPAGPAVKRKALTPALLAAVTRPGRTGT